MIRSFRSHAASLACVLALMACSKTSDEPPLRDGRRVLAAYDDAMAKRGTERRTAVARLRALELVDPASVRARDVCTTMLESLDAATELQTRLEPMADRLDDYVRRDAAVPPAERERVLELYALATRSADATAASIEPCTRAMDTLRTQVLGRNENR